MYAYTSTNKRLKKGCQGFPLYYLWMRNRKVIEDGNEYKLMTRGENRKEVQGRIEEYCKSARRFEDELNQLFEQ